MNHSDPPPARAPAAGRSGVGGCRLRNPVGVSDLLAGLDVDVMPPVAVKGVKRVQVWDKTGGHCHYCGCELHPFWSFTIDHVIPKSRGGTNAIENLVAACPVCNIEKGTCLIWPKMAAPGSHEGG